MSASKTSEMSSSSSLEMFFTMGFFVLQNLPKSLHPIFFLVFFFSPTVEPSNFSDEIALLVAAKGNTALNPKYF